MHTGRHGSIPDGIADRCYLGPSWAGLALGPRPGLTVRRLDAPARHLAARLAEGDIVGVFRGALEAGPRALGNRSILASPLSPYVAHRLNDKVKFREPFRPFAPVVLADQAGDYFEMPHSSPFMSMAFPATERARDVIGPVIHVNGTARVQTLNPDDNRFLAQVLSWFQTLTGIPVLINTSLNVKGKPICGTPEMALDVWTG